MMYYYIDFEASEAEKKIISVGCICEDGREFYSLVNTDDPITFRITQITGITQEDVNEAPASEKVFADLFDWCYSEDEAPQFICYGDGDFDFVYANSQCTTGYKEALMLSYLYLNMYDCSQDMKDHFLVNKTISLEKLGQHYDETMGAQNHNALDDAKLLKMVYEKMNSGQTENNVFNEYLSPSRIPSQIRKVVRLVGNEVANEFESLSEAVKWMRTQPNDKGGSYLNNAEEKIITAARNGSKYFNSYWRIL
ncbi:MAG: 3'-5' exoribonuclease [Erysipelotrichaceae bacterium]|nr:3'-5' exoribonuclease [Erysipelotrichaceae bacterium]